ncbi:hypothetical protein OIV83_000081 [Microbotryomycetes sp. JL201]|nr:hypothetical protein OIV83_000081 [Microbotryomycetes sp. JL201]
MPPRLNKRQQREQAELAELAAAHPNAAQDASTLDAPLSDQQVTEDIDDDHEQPRTAQVANAFGALNLDDADGGDSGDDDIDQQATTAPQSATKASIAESQRLKGTDSARKAKNKKKKKKGSTAATGSATPGTESADTPQQQRRADKKKLTKPDEDLDEIDRALAEIAAKQGTTAESDANATNARQRPEWRALKEVFAFEPKLLDSDAELKRMFGSKVVGSTQTSAPRSPYHARLANNPHHSTSVKRANSFLAQPEPGWYPPTGVLKLLPYDGPESKSDEGDWYTFDHPWEYRAAQLSFLEVLQQADGNRLFNVLQTQPYHVDTLMQLSEMMAHQGDLGASSTNLNRALYAMSAPLPATFPSGNFRLPYSRIENRAFFLAVARKVALLTKRGTWRTACEWAKIGLGVGGGQDPVGMLTFVDFLAPKARQNEWFMSMLDALPKAYPQQEEMRLEIYPGLAFAKALCLRNVEEDNHENTEKSTEALRSAILRFPMVVTLLLTALGGTIPPQLVSHRRAQVNALYSARSSPLWKPPALQTWLEKTATSAAKSLDDTSLEDVRIGQRLFDEGAFPAGTAPAGIIRAAYIADMPSVRPYLPPTLMSQTSYSFDPVPPSRQSGATFYDDSYFAPLYQSSRQHQRRARQNASGGATSARGMAQAAANMRDQLAQLLGIGPQGPQVDLNPELRAELLREFEMLGGGGGGGAGGELPPGAFPGVGEDDEEGQEGEWDEDEDEGNADEDQVAPEQARNFLGRLAALFGQNADEQE